jgi:hypothetical protein
VIAQSRRKIQAIHRQPIVCTPDIDPRRRCSLRGQSFPNKQNDPEGFLHDPIFEIENAEAGKGEKADQSEYLVPPFHGAT